MFPLMIPMIIGGGAGMLLNKKNPLEGALLGAGLGALGGAAAPALGLGASTAATGGAASAAATGGGLGLGTSTAVPALGTQTAVPGLGYSGKAVTGLGLNLANAGGAAPAAAQTATSGLLSTIKEYKPVIEAIGTGMQAANMLEQPEPPPIQHSPMMQPTPNPQMNALLEGMQNEQVQRKLVEQHKRAMRRALL